MGTEGSLSLVSFVVVIFLFINGGTILVMKQSLKDQNRKIEGLRQECGLLKSKIDEHMTKEERIRMKKISSQSVVGVGHNNIIECRSNHLQGVTKGQLGEQINKLNNGSIVAIFNSHNVTWIQILDSEDYQEVEYDYGR